MWLVVSLFFDGRRGITDKARIIAVFEKSASGFARCRQLNSSAAHQVFENELIEPGIIAVGDKVLSFVFIESANLFEEAQESAAAVVEVGKPVFDFCGAERVNIKADVFAVLAVAVAFKGADLVECDA